MANIIGIDLGTTYSVVSKLDKSGRSEVLRDEDGQNLTPSSIFFEGADRSIVGWEAHREAASQPTKVAQEFKRDMGTDTTFNGHELTPTELSALVLKKLKKIAESNVGEVDTAVVTVPANFTNGARVATMNAAKAANLPVENIVNEPTAAAVYYAFAEDISGKIAVYDLGGGTFDVSIVYVSGDDVDVLASQGNQRLGGTDFDRCLLELIDEKYKAKTGSSHDVQPTDLSKTLEEMKRSLSSRESVLAAVEPPEQPPENIEITRDEFNAKIGTLITKAAMLFEAALEEAGLEPTDLDHVVLVGGSTRVPAVRESVEKMVGKPALATKNVDEVVALGAAIYAGLKAKDVNLTEAQKGAISPIDLTEVCNHFYGTIVLTHDTEKEAAVEKVSVLIKKNSSIPVSVSESFFTAYDGQGHVDCTVTQSVTEETDPRWVTKVREVTLGPLPPNRPAGKEVKVSFRYDDNQIMFCRFEDVESGMSEEIEIDLASESVESAAADIDKFLVE